MGYYTLTAPGVVAVGGKHRHYATIPAQPIKVDDAEAAPQVESGVLMPYPAVRPTPVAEPVEVEQPESSAIVDEPADEPEAPAPTPRRRRKGDGTH